MSSASRTNTPQEGFTIVELLIATTVFSLVLLLITTALIQIGRTYYKAYISTQTQEVARAVVNDLAQTIQYSGGDDTSFTSKIGLICIDSTRYSYIAARQLSNGPSTDTKSPHVLVKDTGVSPCNSFQNLAGGLTNSSTELLGENMRINELLVSQQSGGVWKIKVNIGYGDDDLFTAAAPGANPECKNGPGQQFCTVAQLETTVRRRLAN